MGLKQRTVLHAGQSFVITAIPGDVAHDNKGRVLGHLAAALAQIPGVDLALILAIREGQMTTPDGETVGRADLLAVLMRRLSLDNVASAAQVLFSRLNSSECASLRQLLLSSAVVSGPPDGGGSEMHAVGVLDALKRNDLVAGPLVIDWLLWEAIALSILPFSDLDGSAFHAAMGNLPDALRGSST